MIYFSDYLSDYDELNTTRPLALYIHVQERKGKGDIIIRNVHWNVMLLLLQANVYSILFCAYQASSFN